MFHQFVPAMTSKTGTSGRALRGEPQPSRPFRRSDQLSERWGQTSQSAEAATARRVAAFGAAAAGRFWPSKFGCPSVPGGCRDQISVLRWLWRLHRKGNPTAEPRGKGRPTDRPASRSRRWPPFFAAVFVGDGAAAGRRVDIQKCAPGDWLPDGSIGVGGRGREGPLFCV